MGCVLATSMVLTARRSSPTNGLGIECYLVPGRAGCYISYQTPTTANTVSFSTATIFSSYNQQLRSKRCIIAGTLAGLDRLAELQNEAVVLLRVGNHGIR